MNSFDVLNLTTTWALITIASSQYGDLSTVLVQTQEETKVHVFELPREKVSSVSRFFKKAFQGNFLGATTGTMSIIDVSAEVFDMFADWVMTDRLGAYSLEQLLALYVLADRIDLPKLLAFFKKVFQDNGVSTSDYVAVKTSTIETRSTEDELAEAIRTWSVSEKRGSKGGENYE
jgi:hypothetical protein